MFLIKGNIINKFVRKLRDFQRNIKNMFLKSFNSNSDKNL